LQKVSPRNSETLSSSLPVYVLTFLVNAKIVVRIPRKTRFLKKAGFPDLSGKNF
jgi:hypothetical protein